MFFDKQPNMDTCHKRRHPAWTWHLWQLKIDC